MGIKTKKTRYNKRGGKRAKNKTKKRKQRQQDKYKQEFKKLNCSPENKEKEYTLSLIHI